MTNNTYQGFFSNGPEWYQVFLNGKIFDPKPSQKVYNHSPDGWAFGYSGSGPAQLALGILLQEFGKEVALEHYQNFKRDVIAHLPNTDNTTWTLTSNDVQQWLARRIT